MTVSHTSDGLLLDQRQYMLDLLDRACMSDCKTCNIVVDTQSKLSIGGPPVADPSSYHSMAGVLQYLTFPSSDIAYAVQQICLYMHDPREPHLTALKRILHYIHGTLDLGLCLYKTSTTDLVVYSEAD
jgi:hypothetical protein